MNILILDDHPIVRQGIISILNMDSSKNVYYESSSVNDALDILRKVYIDIAFVDLQLGKESGFDFIREAKELDKNVKIVVVTSSTRQSDMEIAQELGVDGYIIKDALAEDIIYAMRVIRRNQKFITPIFMNTLEKNEWAGYDTLTKREQEVFDLLKAGKTNAQISEDLYISQATTKKHVSNILAKLNLKHRVEVALYANNM